MSNIKKSITELIGKTPILEMLNYKKVYGYEANILAKLEYFNPAGSVKDRVALEMILEAEKNGLVKPGATFIEPTSGNTGIGIAAVASSRGYRAIMVMPDTMSEERRKLLKAYGAEIVLTEGKLGMKGSIDKANELKEEIEGAVILGQFTNPDNPKAHIKTTGPEIWEDTDGNVDILVAGVGTGGTLTGTATYLKNKNPELKVVAVEPYESQVIATGVAGAHEIQGIGANFVPEILDKDVIDEIFPVKTEDAILAGREIGQIEGFLVGISSGAALFAARNVAARPENAGKNVVVILPDSGDRYLSTALYEV